MKHLLTLQPTDLGLSSTAAALPLPRCAAGELTLNYAGHNGRGAAKTFSNLYRSYGHLPNQNSGERPPAPIR